MSRDLTFLWEEAGHETLDENKQQRVRRLGGRSSTGPGARGKEPTTQTTCRFNGSTRRGTYEAARQHARQRSPGPVARRLTPNPAGCSCITSTPWGDDRSGQAGTGHRVGGQLSFEVIPAADRRSGRWSCQGRRCEIVRGLAQSRETEFCITLGYNTLTTGVNIDGLLGASLAASDLANDPVKVAAAVRAGGAHSHVRHDQVMSNGRWGHGQEDVYPVACSEKVMG